MTSDMTWQARGVRPQPLEAAREAARRSGMSVGEWLDSVILESARQEGVVPAHRPAGDRPGEDRRHRDGHAPEVNARLDTRAQQLDRLAATSAAIGVPKNRRDENRRDENQRDQNGRDEGRRGDDAPRQIANALSQLDRRLDQLIVERRSPERDRHAASSSATIDAQMSRPAPAASPLDQALAEIAERQRMLDSDAMLARPDLPRAPTQGYGGLEQQLRSINSRIESLKPGAINGAVEMLRDHLAEIGVMIKEAMPRQAIEALETEVRSLAQRIDSKRDAGADAADLAGVERGLLEVRDALRALTPAENLVGFESAVGAMSQKIDGIAALAQDPAAIEHLEGAIAGLRGIVSHVASNEALTRLSDDVRALATKVEQVAGSDILAMLEQRITVIADALQSRPQADRDVHDLEALVQGLADKIERLQLASVDHPNSSQIEEQIARLIDKIESSDARLGQLDKIERGLAELLLQIDRQSPPQPVAGEATPLPELDDLRRDVQRTQDSIEAVHGTLGQVVDRLAIIETGLQGATVASQPTPASTGPAPVADAMTPASVPGAAALPAVGLGNPAPTTDWGPIDPDLPPDHPLEPGANRRGGSSPAERIAASEAALGTTRGSALGTNLGASLGASRPAADPALDAKASFIAAARRAAQAASTQLTGRNDKRAPELSRRARTEEQPANGLGGHARMLLIAASVVMIVLGSLQVLTGFFSRSGSNIAVGPDEPTASALPHSNTPDEPEPPPANPPGRQSGLLPVDTAIATPNAGMLALPDPFASASMPAIPDTAAPAQRLATGSVRQPTAASTPAQAPARPTDADKLPASIAGGLRTAAARGDAAAEFEIAVRFAEGRGMPQNFAAAAEWFERAAKQGLAPAQFRLGGLYEKGMGVKKDLEAARRLYIAAAQAGNAKAMHNLAVLYAEGADGRPDYQSAALWFRKAADHGVTDSQYNLGILYARGIGVETNLAEAYKWFALAAREGDRDSAKKRDELGTRLDQATAAAAHSAVRAWIAEPQPEAATQVKTPPAGWDGGPAPSTAKRRVTTDTKAPRATP